MTDDDDTKEEECIYCKPDEPGAPKDRIRFAPVAWLKERRGAPEEASVDLYRDTPVRLLGYANEVGEAFRALVPVAAVRLSYVLAAGYVLADTADKALAMAQKSWPGPEERLYGVGGAAADTLLWQSMASVVIPGFTINRICAVSSWLMARTTKWPNAARKWTTTVVGLCCIPFIIRPIDRSVDVLMDHTFRRWMPPAAP